MKLRVGILLLIMPILIIGIGYNAFALTSTQKGKILKNFKAQEYKMLFESENIFLDSSTKNIFESSRRMQLYKGIRDKVAEKREFLEQENIKILSKINNLEGSLKILDKDILNLKEETRKINNQIIEIDKKIRLTQKTISFLKEKITTNKKILYEYIIYLYKKGNYVFENGKIDNLKAIFFSGEDISSALNDLHFKGLIEITGKRLIDNHRSYVSDLYIKQIGLNKTQSESKSLRKQLIIKKAIMEQKKNFKKRLISISQGKQRIYKKFIAEKRIVEKNLQGKEFAQRVKFKSAKKEILTQEGCSYVDFSKIHPSKSGLTDKCKKLNTIIFIESRLRGFSTDNAGNIFRWPVSPIKGLSATFNDKDYVKTLGEDHDAIDIPVPQGTDIQAPADGYVILVKNPTTLDYSFVALKHSDGHVTVYGHLSEVLVKKLDYVKSGEVFAKTGGTYGTPGAGFLTTGPHLHLEVWKDKVISDPLNFLNISVLRIKELPDKYIRKYKIDFKARKGHEYKGKISKKRKAQTFTIKGKTEIERQKYFLDHYAVGDFKKWSIWVEEGIDADIDPTFLMCVGIAETGLGRHLKTPYNVGNVGNTDSGATKKFKSARDGIHAMLRTFNNKYLGHYNQINLLSRYGNKTGTIYASSDFNWHNNIVSCMSHIKGRFIPDHFNFRLK